MKTALWMGPLLLGVAGCNWGESRDESVDALMEAIEARDSIAVDRYIDVGRVAQSAVEPLIEAATLLATMDPGQAGGLAGGMDLGMLQQFRPMLAPLMEQVFWQMMLSPESLERGPLGSILGNAPIRFDRMSEFYRGVISESDDDDGLAFVSVELTAQGADAVPVIIDLAVEREERHWKVVGFANLTGTMLDLMAGRR